MLILTCAFFLLQFTCASPTVAARLTKRGTQCGSGDVWVASSDGCVGQVSMLSPLREFEVSSCGKNNGRSPV